MHGTIRRLRKTGGLFAWFVRWRTAIRENWHSHYTVFSKTYLTIDGEAVRTDLIMRRFHNGKLEYRLMTQAEDDDRYDGMQY